jgi:hypothetical protein
MAKINVDIGLNSAALDAGLARAGASVRNWAGGIRSQIAAAFSVAAVGAAMRSTIAYIDQVGNAAQSLNMPVERFQALALSAKMAGVEIAKVGSIINTLVEAQSKAVADPGGKEAQQFAKLGMDMEKLKTMSSDDVFIKSAQAMSGMSLSDAHTNFGALLGKKDIGELYRMSPEFGGDFNARVAGLKQKGYIASESDANTINKYNDELDAEIQRLRNTLIPTTITFLSAMRSVVEFLAESATKMSGGGGGDGSVAGYVGGVGGMIGEAAGGRGMALGKSAFGRTLGVIGAAGNTIFDLIGKAGSSVIPGSPVNRALTDYLFGTVDTSNPNHDPSALPLTPRGSNAGTGPSPSVGSNMIDNILMMKDMVGMGVDASAQIHKGRNIYSDPLTEVGNFLGSNLKGLSGAAGLLSESKKHTMLLNKLNVTLEAMRDKLPGGSGGVY